MGKSDLNNLFNLAVGAVVGVIIYNVYKSHLDTHAYAVEAEPINCDGPKPWNPRERRRFQMMSPNEQENYLETREVEFKRLCKAAAREINSDLLAGSPMYQNLNPANAQYSKKRGIDPLYPQRAHGSLGQGLEYPTYDEDAHAFFEPSLPSQFGGNQAAFALAYAAAKKKKKAKGGKPAKGGGKAAKGGGGADTAPADSGGDAAAPSGDTPPVDSNTCDCTCKPMDSDPSRFKIETAAGVDCYNHVYPPSEAECQTALKDVCAKRGGAGGAADAAPADKPAKGGKAAKGGAKAVKGGGASDAGYAMAYATYMRAYAAAKKKAAKGGAADAAPAADAKPAKGGGAAPADAAPAAAAPASGGGNCGKLVYKGTGKTATPKDSGQKTRHYASGKPDDKTEEWNIANSSFTNYEYTAYVNIGKPDHDDQVSFKMWGPQHKDGQGAWYLMDVGFMKGDFSLGHEKPHPKTTMGEVKGKSIGSIVGKLVGLKSVVYQTPGGAHIEGWYDNGGTWVKQVEGDNVGGKFTRDPAQNIQLRIDAAQQVKVQCAQASEITPPTGGGGGAAPAGKAAPSTPAKGAAPAGKASKAGAGYITNDFRVTLA